MAPAESENAVIDLVHAWDEHEAALVAAHLRDSGIEAVVVGAGLGNWSEAPGLARPRVQIRLADRERALQHLIELSDRINAERRDSGRALTCPACGYDLTGSTSPRCPECGLGLEDPPMRFTLVDPQNAGAGPARSLLIGIAVVLLGFAAVAIAVAVF